jgi:hypothetical protein
VLSANEADMAGIRASSYQEGTQVSTNILLVLATQEEEQPSETVLTDL